MTPKELVSGRLLAHHTNWAGGGGEGKGVGGWNHRKPCFHRWITKYGGNPLPQTGEEKLTHPHACLFTHFGHRLLRAEAIT